MKSDGNYMARDSMEILQELREGVCLLDLSDKLQEATAAAMKTGKKAVVTLKLTITPQGTQAIVKDDIEAKVPIFPVQPTVMFVDDENNLTRRSPRQMSLSDAAIRVPAKEESVRVDPETGEVIKVQ